MEPGGTPEGDAVVLVVHGEVGYRVVVEMLFMDHMLEQVGRRRQSAHVEDVDVVLWYPKISSSQ
jgi:hypothetical protein